MSHHMVHESKVSTGQQSDQDVPQQYFYRPIWGKDSGRGCQAFPFKFSHGLTLFPIIINSFISISQQHYISTYTSRMFLPH